ncbi:MAG: CpXC domain-containing protein, partial [Anaerolineales bacterium]
MAQSVTQIRCPNCQTPIQASIEQIIDVGQDPSAKARLLSGSLNQVACPQCGYQGQLATPLVYHDPEKELLLTYMPAEVGMNKDEQEKLIGRLINQIVDRLPQEERKAYLLQPKSVLTLQGMVEQILEADGITKEDIEAQQEKLRLFEQLMRTPEDDLEQFVQEHDDELDQEFFQLASLALQSAEDPQSRQAAGQRLEAALRLSGVGQQI